MELFLLILVAIVAYKALTWGKLSQTQKEQMAQYAYGMNFSQYYREVCTHTGKTLDLTLMVRKLQRDCQALTTQRYYSDSNEVKLLAMTQNYEIRYAKMLPHERPDDIKF